MDIFEPVSFAVLGLTDFLRGFNGQMRYCIVCETLDESNANLFKTERSSLHLPRVDNASFPGALNKSTVLKQNLFCVASGTGKGPPGHHQTISVAISIHSVLNRLLDSLTIYLIPSIVESVSIHALSPAKTIVPQMKPISLQLASQNIEWIRDQESSLSIHSRRKMR